MTASAQKRSIGLLVLGLLIVVLGLTACGDDSDSEDTTAASSSKHLDPGQALALARKSGAVPQSIVFTSGPGPNPAGTRKPPPLKQVGESFLETDTPVGPEIAREPAGGFIFQLGKFGTAKVIPAEVSDSASDGRLIADDRALFFANTYAFTDTVIRPAPIPGITLTLHIRGREAPEHFAWEITANDPLVFQKKSNSAGLAHRERGVVYPLGIQPYPYAHDSSGLETGGPGEEVEVQLAVDDDLLTVDIVHARQDLVYPVIVDLGWEAALSLGGG